MPARQSVVSGDLTLDKAVEIVLRHNPEILKAIQEIERTRGQLIAVRAQALPRLGINASYTERVMRGSVTRSGGTAPAAIVAPLTTTTDGAPQATTTDAVPPVTTTDASPPVTTTDVAPPTTATDVAAGGAAAQFGGASQAGTTRSSFSSQQKAWRVVFNVRQNLYAGGSVRAAVRSAQFTEDRAYWDLRETVDRLVARVRQQFYTVLLNRALISVQEESITLLGAQLKDQQNRFKVGEVARFNVLQAEVALSNARPQLILARNNYLISQLTLFRTLGLPPQPDGKPALQVVGTFDFLPRSFDATEALRLARERRAFLKAERQTILIEAEQLKVALAGYLPRLDANGGYQLRNSRRSDDIDDMVDGWLYGLTGKWNIFDGLATAGRAQQARARLESAKITYDDAVQQVELEVQQALARLRQAQETVQSQEKSVEQALEALRLAGLRFSAGAGIQLEVLDARVALTRARTTALEARAAYHIALAEFDRATASGTVYDESFQDPLTSGPRKRAPRPERSPDSKQAKDKP